MVIQGETPVMTVGPSKDHISAVVAVKDTNNFISTLPRIANIHVRQTPAGTLLETNKTPNDAASK